MTLVARHAALTDIGLHRSTNEDAFVAEPPLFAVADGMGGAQAGEVASHLALESLVEALAADAALPDAAAGRQRRRLSALAHRPGPLRHGHDPHRGPAGRRPAPFAHVGDSRLYLWRDETLEQVTDDHSLVGEMVREGHLTREAALSHPQRSILSRALGTEPRVQIDSGEVALRAGDTVVLCSDGLYSMVAETTIAAVLAAVDDPLRIARQLIREAKNEGGHDNITVIVLRLDPAGDDDGADDGDPASAARPRRAVLPVAGAEATTAVLPALDGPLEGDEQLTLDERAAREPRAAPTSHRRRRRPRAADADVDDADASSTRHRRAELAADGAAPSSTTPADGAIAPRRAEAAAAPAAAPRRAPPPAVARPGGGRAAGWSAWWPAPWSPTTSTSSAITTAW